MKIFTRTLLAAAIGFSAHAQAQNTFEKGFVVTTQGDTLKGEIKVNAKKEADLYSKVQLKISETERKSFNPAKLKTFTVGENTFVSKVVDGEKVFMRRLSNGSITLLEWKSIYLNRVNEEVVATDLFVEKEGKEGLVRLKSSKFKKQMAELMQDNSEIVQDLEAKKYEYENISDLIETYNAWAKENGKG